jgi:hypothetical protein
MSPSWIGCFPNGTGRVDSEMKGTEPGGGVPAAGRQLPRLEYIMIVIFGLIILLAAVIVGVAGVLSNSGSEHALTHGFSVFGYHVTGSTGTLFLYGVVVGVVALAGLSLLLVGARRTSRRGRAARRGLRQSRQQTAAVSQDRDDLIDQREAARAYAAGTPGNGTPRGDRHPGAASRRGRLRLFGRRATRRHAAVEPQGPTNGQAASDVPASVPAPADQLTNGSRP